MNRGVARQLGVGIGDTVVALGNASDGRMSAVRLKVTGIWVVKGLEAYEWGACYADLAAGAGAGGRRRPAAACSSSASATADAPSAPIAACLNALFAREGIAAEAHTWEEMGGPFIGGMLVTRFVANIIDMVMAMIVAAGVLNTALMSVFERTREVGTLRAFGARRSRVLSLYLVEAALLGAAGGARRGRARRGPRRLLRPLRHPRLQRGAALLVRRRLPLPAAELGVSSPCPR